MATGRREFVKLAAIGGAGLGFGSGGLTIFSRPKRAPLRILVLGGSGFIGPYHVQSALDRGHTVSMFNRGRTNPGLFPTVEKLVGDRSSDLKALEGRQWDIVLDNSATDPTWVERSATLLQKACKRYIFTSTRSVYNDTSRVPMTVDAPVCTRENTPVEPGKPLPYCLAKALSEGLVRKYFPDNHLIIRASLIVGPGDLTDRFTYWPVRIEKGGEVLAPGDGSDFVQFIDARDICEWMIRLAEMGTTGTYNGLGPKQPRTFAELLHGIKAVTTSDATFTWVDGAFLEKHTIRPYQEMPVWMPSTGNRAGFARFDISREIALGLTFRSLAVTAKDTLDYYHAQTPQRQETLRAGITPAKEAEVLTAWRTAGRAR